MFTLRTVAQPETLEAAYKLVTEKRNNAILGGCAYLRLGSQTIPVGVDLSKLGLQYITEHSNTIEIGAMTSLRDVETHAVLKNYGDGLVPKAVANIVGVQFRNIATVGASVFMRYGFSDFLTALLALDAEVELVKGGRMSLFAFLDSPRTKDILTKVIIHKCNGHAAYQALRNSAADYPLLTVAVSRLGDQWRIAVGARPTRAKLAVQAAAWLENAGQEMTATVTEEAARLAVTELPFGSNRRASAAYRQAVAETLIKRGIAEVAACK